MANATLAVVPPERILEIGGDIHAPLRRLRERYLRKFQMTHNTFYAQAANRLSRLITNLYQEDLDEAKESAATGAWFPIEEPTVALSAEE